MESTNHTTFSVHGGVVNDPVYSNRLPGLTPVRDTRDRFSRAARSTASAPPTGDAFSSTPSTNGGSCTKCASTSASLPSTICSGGLCQCICVSCAGGGKQVSFGSGHDHEDNNDKRTNKQTNKQETESASTHVMSDPAQLNPRAPRNHHIQLRASVSTSDHLHGHIIGIV